MAALRKKGLGIVLWAGLGILVGMQLASIGEYDLDSAGREAVQVQQAQASPPEVPVVNLYDIPVGEGTDRSRLDVSEEYSAENYDQWQRQTPEQILLPDAKKPAVDVLADKASGLLQGLSQKGIHLVVSLFTSFTE